MRLRQAGESGDVNEIQSALMSVSQIELPNGVSLSAEVQDLAAELRQRIVEDADLAHLDMLRRSRDLKYQMRRLWDLMVAESDMIRDEAEAVGSPVIGKRGAPATHAHKHTLSLWSTRRNAMPMLLLLLVGQVRCPVKATGRCICASRRY